MNMTLTQDNQPRRRPRRPGIALMQLGVVLAATIGGGARAGYLYDASALPVEKGAPPAASRSNDIDEAAACFRRGDYSRCLELLRELRETSPGSAPARTTLAQWFLLDNQPAQAREALELASAEDPGHPRAYLLLGAIALGEGRATEAAALFEKALALAGSAIWPDDSRKGFQGEARAGLAAVAEHRGDWDAASSWLAARLEVEPKDGAARVRLARALFRQGRRDGIFEELRHAARDDPGIEPPAMVMAELYAGAGDAKKAAEWVDYAVKAAPRDPKAHLGAALWYLSQDDAPRARALAETAAKLDPASDAVAEVRGLVAWHRKDYAEAERLFQEVFVARPDDARACALWALALAEQPSEAKRRRALKLAESNARLNPGSSEALTALGRLYHLVGRPEDAERALRAALATGHVAAETPYYLARVLDGRGRDNEVAPLLKLCVAATGRFAFRAEAREWLAKFVK
jgi:tetratricopeptide (TPR) repeat protein